VVDPPGPDLTYLTHPPSRVALRRGKPLTYLA